MKTRKYFKVEAVRTALFLLVLYFVVYFVTRYRLSGNMEVYWDVAIIMAATELITLFIAWLIYGSKN